MPVINKNPAIKVAPSTLTTTATVGAGREVMAMSGHNQGGFELRAVQETGTH